MNTETTPLTTATAPEPPRQVGLGMHVELELIDEQGKGERMGFDLVVAQAADFEEGLLGENTPLGKAIRGKAVGATTPYRMGDIVGVRILSVGPAHSPAPADATARRQAVLDKALNASERTTTEMFASSFSSKWGSYDPTTLAQPDEA